MESNEYGLISTEGSRRRQGRKGAVCPGRVIQTRCPTGVYCPSGKGVSVGSCSMQLMETDVRGSYSMLLMESLQYGLISTEVVAPSSLGDVNIRFRILLSIAPSFMEFRWKGAGLTAHGPCSLPPRF